MATFDSGRWTRRDLLEAAAVASGAALAFRAGIGRAGERLPVGPALVGAGAVVGYSRDPAVVGKDGRMHADGVQLLFDRAVTAATGQADPAGALRALFTADDVVGIKINCLAGRGLSTHAALVDAIVARLVGAGVRDDRIVIWDRSDRDLKRAGYVLKRAGSGPRVFGTNDDYENEPIEAGAVGGCLSRLLTRTVTAVINVPVLKDHDLSGISGALKSFYGAIHNPNKYHDHNCSPYIADLYAHAAIRAKVRLTVFDGLIGQCHGGPAWVPEHCWNHGAVFVSTDAVAADRTALELIADERQRRGLESLAQAGRAPHWLDLAAARGLGVADPLRIRRVSR